MDFLRKHICYPGVSSETNIQRRQPMLGEHRCFLRKSIGIHRVWHLSLQAPFLRNPKHQIHQKLESTSFQFIGKPYVTQEILVVELAAGIPQKMNPAAPFPWPIQPPISQLSPKNSFCWSWISSGPLAIWGSEDRMVVPQRERPRRPRTGMMGWLNWWTNKVMPQPPFHGGIP